jgi:DNA repair protein RecN (Recombination protein N)
MLQELAISDFAIIKEVRLRCAPGLVIFTGETGAGKSIVLDAIGALLGDRVGGDVVRAGSQRALVEGIFILPWLAAMLERLATGAAQPDDTDDETAPEPPNHQPDPQQRLATLLRDYGLEGDADQIIITREIQANGRSTARVNGRAIPINVLARLGDSLVDVHGQGAHLALLRSEQHIDYLDRAAETLPQRAELADAVRAWQGTKREVATLRRDERELERRAELLRYQVEEIAAAKLQPGEITTMEQERTVLANAERLGEMSDTAHTALMGADDGETPGALDLLAAAERSLVDLARIDTSLSATLDSFEESRYRLEDVAATLRDYRERTEANPERLAEIEDRLNQIAKLRRKYGATIEEVIAYGDEAATELVGIEHRDERIAALEDQIAHERTRLGRMAEDLSIRRQAAAVTMAEQMEAALDRLNMRAAKFVVQMQRQPNTDGVITPEGETIAITSSGIDKVEFLIAPNPGEPPRPLARIASGGETARLMLALKTILAQADAAPTLIFDEVDAGISGLTGQIVGEMLWRLARTHQVICVTHLPQMAAFGDQHWHVAKRVADDRTSTIVTDLDMAGRTLEIAQMLGGVATESAARNAAELLDRAATWKDRDSAARQGQSIADRTVTHARANSAHEAPTAHTGPAAQNGVSAGKRAGKRRKAG